MTDKPETSSQETETADKLTYVGTDEFNRPLYYAAGLTTTLDRWMQRLEYAKSLKEPTP